MPAIPLWIDTDLGGDIDDAFALSLALHSPELRIQGISTVYLGNPWRKGLIQDMLRAYDRQEIPVYPGAEKPLIGAWSQERPLAAPNEAPLAIVQAARQDPGLVLAAIGPLTNVALALSLAPDIAAAMRIFVMGGTLRQTRPEWNVGCDPEAARIVMESGAEITLVGLDVTERCTLTRAQAMDLVAGEHPERRFLQQELRRFFELFSFDPTLHDPLTLAALLWEDLFTFSHRDVRVETQGAFSRGLTVWQRETTDPAIRVAEEVAVEEAMRRMCGRI